jgi:hypothetical protein
MTALPVKTHAFGQQALDFLPPARIVLGYHLARQGRRLAQLRPRHDLI